MKKPPFINNEIYHIYNRGVEKRSIFKDDADRFRFIHDLFEFNDQEPATNVQYRFHKHGSKTQSKNDKSPRKLLIEILAFCLMPNHYHLLVRQKKQKGVINFMQKFGTGYTLYFNQKHSRVGPLFQGRFKAVLISEHKHILYLPHYIHLNPLDLTSPQWREGSIKNHNNAMKFLETYRWSSLLDYLGQKNFPSLTSRAFLLELFGGGEKYKEDLATYLSGINLESIQDLLLE